MNRVWLILDGEPMGSLATELPGSQERPMLCEAEGEEGERRGSLVLWELQACPQS